jgi:hypothetical protein
MRFNVRTGIGHELRVSKPDEECPCLGLLLSRKGCLQKSPSVFSLHVL